MGCDIHMVLEKKDPNLGWVGINDFSYIHTDNFTDLKKREYIDDTFPWLGWRALTRRYSLFAKLANVRGDGGVDPRGIPHDASHLTRMRIREWGSDGHSHSYMLLSEALPLFVEAYEDMPKLVAMRLEGKRVHASVAGRLFGVDIDDDAELRGNDNNLDNYRIVFWFDN